MRKRNPKWEALKMAVRERSGGTCERCHGRPGQHVHHLWYAGKRRGEEDLEQLQHVCLVCHGWYHPKHTFLSLYQQSVRHLARKRRSNGPFGDVKCDHCGKIWYWDHHKTCKSRT